MQVKRVVGLVIGLFAFATSDGLAQSRKVDLAVAIEGDSTLQHRGVYLLELGPVPTGETSVTLIVKNLGAPRNVSAISEARDVEIQWAASQYLNAAWSMPLHRNAVTTLHVTIRHGAPLTTRGPIILGDDSGALVSIWPDYLLIGEPKKFVEMAARELTSGNGKSYNDTAYTFCSGPAPPGYHYVPRDNEMTVAGRMRHCGNYATCDPTVRSDKNVCYDVKVQGDEAHNGEPDEIERFEAKLRVEYAVTRTKPQLR